MVVVSVGSFGIEDFGPPTVFDVTLRGSNGIAVYAHSHVLARRAEYFKSAFRSTLASDKEFNFPDLSAGVLDFFLRFVYEGRAEVGELLLIPGIRAGDFFQAKDFIEACETQLCRLLVEDKKRGFVTTESATRMIRSLELGSSLRRYRLMAFAKEALMRHLHQTGMLADLTEDCNDFDLIETLFRLLGLDIAVRLKKDPSFLKQEFWNVLSRQFEALNWRARIALSVRRDRCAREAFRFLSTSNLSWTDFRKLDFSWQWEKKRESFYDNESRKIVQVLTARRVFCSWDDTYVAPPHPDSDSGADIVFRLIDIVSCNACFVAAAYRIHFPKPLEPSDFLRAAFFGDYAFVATRDRRFYVVSLLRQKVIESFELKIDLTGDPFVVLIRIRGGLVLVDNRYLVNDRRWVHAVFWFDVYDPERPRLISRWRSDPGDYQICLDFFDRLHVVDGKLRAWIRDAERHLDPSVRPFYHPAVSPVGLELEIAHIRNGSLIVSVDYSVQGGASDPVFRRNIPFPNQLIFFKGPRDSCAGFFLFRNKLIVFVVDLAGNNLPIKRYHLRTAVEEFQSLLLFFNGEEMIFEEPNGRVIMLQGSTFI